MTKTTAAASPERPGLLNLPAATPAPAPAALAHGGRVRLAFLSTFNQACGVAAHTAQVMSGLHAAARLRGVDIDMLVLAEEVEGQPCADPPNVHRCWNQKWFDVARTLEVLTRERVDILHVMFHGDRFVNTDLVGLLQACRKRGIRLFGTFHFMDGRRSLPPRRST